MWQVLLLNCYPSYPSSPFRHFTSHLISSTPFSSSLSLIYVISLISPYRSTPLLSSHLPSLSSLLFSSPISLNSPPPLSSPHLISSHLSLISSLLISHLSHLISSHLISSHLISSLTSSHLISPLLFSDYWLFTLLLYVTVMGLANFVAVIVPGKGKALIANGMIVILWSFGGAYVRSHYVEVRTVECFWTALKTMLSLPPASCRSIPLCYVRWFCLNCPSQWFLFNAIPFILTIWRCLPLSFLPHFFLPCPALPFPSPPFPSPFFCLYPSPTLLFSSRLLSIFNFPPTLFLFFYSMSGLAPTSASLRTRLGLFGMIVNILSPFKRTFEFQVLQRQV